MKAALERLRLLGLLSSPFYLFIAGGTQTIDKSFLGDSVF
jgi:hypothetical protein